ncbi:hypothetical protein FH972_024653 [Carpinus fangiana]|uniref:Uncharacterized protein n=1 Tax=Carpinus fangiana TaxID=176857 RepID=A0A5N6KYY3_9ROSI|nr:hypothetical protein FH972_024653 [Carpinus fangiana]
MSVRLADRPLQETHPFAVIPKGAGRQGFSVIVSHAGDWTARLIASPPTALWTRGVPQCGVLRVACMFRRVVVVATGSGIGPCLGLFSGRPDVQARVLWSTPSPLQTYGAAIMATVKQADDKAVIIDTRKTGRPDLVALAYLLYEKSCAEAMMVISNPRVTQAVVHGMEQRGVPVYAPIFDS